MPILLLNLPAFSQPRFLPLTDRALIGRRPFNTLIVPDPTVSRIHAWIGRRRNEFLLFDSGSRTGTLLNGRRVADPTPLKDGDEIRIGFGTITFLESDDLPRGIPPLEPPPPRPAADPYDGGIYFDCACGGPMWVGAQHAGAVGKCRYCGQRLVVPHRSGQTAPVAAPAPPARPAVPPDTCSICQSPIQPADPRTACPSCNLSFHTQCWRENYGCSAYGCDQVNVLAPRTPPAQTAQIYDDAEPSAQDSAAGTQQSTLPWDSVLLAASFVALALSAIAYGVPSALMLLIVLIVLLVGRARRKGLALASILVSLVGIGAGYAMSAFWWQNQRIWERFTRL